MVALPDETKVSQPVTVNYRHIALVLSGDWPCRDRHRFAMRAADDLAPPEKIAALNRTRLKGMRGQANAPAFALFKIPPTWSGRRDYEWCYPLEGTRR